MKHRMKVKMMMRSLKKVPLKMTMILRILTILIPVLMIPKTMI